MSANVPTIFARSYSANLQLLLQVKGSKLRMAVDEGHYTGDQASVVDQIGSIEATQVVSRFGPMGRIDASFDRRWVFPTDYEVPQLIDSFDKLRMLEDPESKYVTNGIYALGRKIDASIITAFMGTAKTGVNGSTSTIFTAGNEVDVATGGANSRLNVAKLHAVRELILANSIDMDEDPVFVGITAKDDSALLKEIEIISKEFKGGDVPVLRDGKLERFLGMYFIHCEPLETLAAGTNEVNIPVWAKSGMHLGIWGEISTSIDIRADLSSRPWQVYAKETIGATRTDEKKVFNIESYRA